MLEVYACFYKLTFFILYASESLTETFSVRELHWPCKIPYVECTAIHLINIKSWMNRYCVYPVVTKGVK